MFETSQSTEKLDAALAKAQGAIGHAAKGAENKAFLRDGKASKYADLASVWDACRAALSANGIAVTQWPVHREGARVHLITRLSHGGEWMQSEFSIPTAKPDAHGHGAAITYLRRFALASALGIVADEDDDGNAASGVKTNGERPTYPKARSREPYAKLEIAMRKMTDLDLLDKWWGDTLAERSRLPMDWQAELFCGFVTLGIQIADSLESLGAFWKAHSGEINGLDEDHLGPLVDAKDAAKAKLNGANDTYAGQMSL